MLTKKGAFIYSPSHVLSISHVYELCENDLKLLVLTEEDS
jgi:hypothetical protein